MAREAGTGVGRWREGPPGASTAPRKATATAKWGRAAFLSALFLAVLGVVVSIIYYVTMLKSPEPAFVPLWITDYQKPERLPLPSLPWLEADRKALADSKVFRKFGQAEKADLNPTREVMEERLENLKATRLDDGLVVYVSAYSRADNLGRVLLVATNSHPYEPESHFPLRRLLEKLKNCKARKKLLVLDIVRTPPDLFDLIGGAEGVADLVQKELRSNDDPAKPFDKDLLVICSCMQGQVSLWSEELQGSVFGHFFRLGLTTDAADKDKNRAVTVRELAEYLAGAVDRWAYQYRGIHQQPYLFGQPPKDFVLATLSSRLAAREPAGKTKPAGEKKKPVEREAAKEELSKEQTKKEPGKTSSGDSPAPKDEASDAGQDSAEEFSYPSWLTEGWKVRNEWWTSGDYALAPRAYRRLQTALVRAEVQWRGGAPVDVIERSLRAELKELTDSMRQARDLTLPAIRSVGQARAFGQHADGESVKALVEILKQHRRPDNLLKPAEQEERLNKAAAAFLERFKEKKSIDMAQVLVDAAAEERFDPSTLGFLDSIVGQSPFSRDLVELRFLAQLAERARQTPQEEWTDDTSKIAKLAWDTVTLAETANSRTSTFPWVRDLLEQADSLRHDAEVLLLPRTEGMASWSRIADAWTRARDAYGFLDSCQQRISQARAALAQARATLPAYLAYLETQDQAQNDGSLWFDTVDATRKLDALMARPAEGPDGAVSRTSDRLRELTNQLATPAQQLQDLVTQLLGPFQPAAIRDLLGRVEKGQLDPGLGLTIEALLATPFMSAQERQSLWKTGRRLDQRIEEALATKGERLETEPETTSRAGRDRIPSVRKIAERRAQYMAALLRLGGEETTAEQLAGGVKLAQEMKELPGVGGAEAQSESTMLTGLWMREVQMVRNVKTKMVSLLNQSGRDDPDDRLGWVAPMFEVDWQTNPTRETRQREASAAWAWLTARHRQLSQDSENLEGRPDRFHDEAALEYAQLSSESAQEKTLRLVRTASAPVRIVAQRAGAPVRETVQIVLQGPAAARPAKVALVPLTVDDPRLEVKVVEPAIGELQLAPMNPANVVLQITWNERTGGTGQSTPRGFLLEARLEDQRAYHLAVPTEIITEQGQPLLVLSSSLKEPIPVEFDNFLLRPLPSRQEFHIFVINPSDKNRNVVVELLDGDIVVAQSGDKTPPLKGKGMFRVEEFKSLLGTLPPLKPEDRLPELPANLKLRLKDKDTGHEIVSRPLQPRIAAPEEYVELVQSQSQFTPARGSDSNRLSVTLRARRGWTGPSCPIELVIPAGDKVLFPAFQGSGGGTLKGNLEPGKTIQLFVEDIRLDPKVAEDKGGVFFLNVDGFERAIALKANFVADGDEQSVALDHRPRIRFRADIQVEPDKPATLSTHFQTDNAPTDAVLRFQILQIQNGAQVAAIKPWDAPAKNRHCGFDPRGEAGALLFEASVQDQSRVFPVAGIRGRCYLYAELYEAGFRSRVEIASITKILDDAKIAGAGIQVARSIEKGKAKLPVRGLVTPPSSGISEVAFIVGRKADFEAAEKEGRVTKAIRTGNDRAWDATLTIPKDPPAKLFVTARFKSGVGLTEFATEEVEVREPPPPAEEAAAKKKEPPKPGSVAGVVREAGVVRPGLKVYLMDPNAKDPTKMVIKDAITKDDGSFAFEEINPGEYMLFCENDNTKRSASPRISVSAGEVTRSDLELLLH